MSNEIDLLLSDLELLVDDATVNYMRAQALAHSGYHEEANSLMTDLGHGLLAGATAEQKARTALEADLVASYKPADLSYDRETLEQIKRLNALAARHSEMAIQVAAAYNQAGGQ